MHNQCTGITIARQINLNDLLANVLGRLKTILSITSIFGENNSCPAHLLYKSILFGKYRHCT